MFTLEDGREHLFQWDLDRKIIIDDPTINEVHFCNKTDDCSLVVEVQQTEIFANDKLAIIYSVANIPNILLQNDFPIRVYAYCNDGYTKVEEVFKVKSRTKPSDYVYTETEVKSYDSLEARVKELEKMDLSNIYTKAETDTAIAEAKEVFYFDFKNYTPVSITEAMPEHAAVLTRIANGEQLVVFAKGSYDTYALADVKIYTSDLIWLITHNTAVSEETLIVIYQCSRKSDIWRIKIEQQISANYVTEAEVQGMIDEAIAGVTTGDIDLSNYYTKEEVNALFEGIATAEGGSY